MIEEKKAITSSKTSTLGTQVMLRAIFFQNFENMQFRRKKIRGTEKNRRMKWKDHAAHVKST